MKKWNDYSKLCRQRRRGAGFEGGIVELRKILDEVSDAIKGLGKNGEYAIKMEQAYIAFSEGNIDAAKRIYSDPELLTNGEDQWFPYFRTGECCLALEEIGEALVAFDLCEEKMANHEGDVVDRYHAKVGLAYAYWSLGKEFLLTCVEKMKEAKTLIEPYLKSNDNEDATPLKFSLANNLCFYYLENWLATPETSEVHETHERKHLVDEQFCKLKSLYEKYPNNVSSNVCDTLAWYCFQVAERELPGSNRQGDLLNQAKIYIQRGEHLSNHAPSRMISNSIQREHVQMILSRHSALTQATHSQDVPSSCAAQEQLDDADR